jgi:diguanylate cyclase (GGDEF)-like protein/PAS domain S-box-containing protein
MFTKETLTHCPHCGEEVYDGELICPHCFSDLLLPGPLAQRVPLASRAESPSDLLTRVFQTLAEGILITDAKANIIWANGTFLNSSGYSESEVLGKNPNLLKSNRHDKAFYDAMWRSITTSGHWQGEIWNRRKSGELFLESLSISVLEDEAGGVTHYIGVYSDISAQKQREAQLHFLATHDPLTELPNRTLFRDRLNQAILRAQRSQRLVAVLFIDLDNFKAVNDTYGHDKGDRVLQAVARRLSGCIRQSDTIARSGGDEFTGLIEDLTNLYGAVTVAENILAVLSKPFRLEQEEFYITASVGISIYPIDGSSGDVLIQKSDVAMYRAKSLGKNDYQFHTPWR